MALFDTHSHVSFKAYQADADQVILRMKEEGVQTVTVGTQSTTSLQAIALAEKHEGVWASVGLHPLHIDADINVATAQFDENEVDFTPRREKVDIEQMVVMAKHPKVVAIGECGLDYYRIDSTHVKAIKEAQAHEFLKQMQVASRCSLPIIVHCRDAYADQKKLIEQGIREYGYNIPGVMHCFTGTYEEAKLFLDLGWFISFSGIATFAPAVGEVAKRIPLEQLVIETDAPYLTPPPHRGKRNEPLYVKFIAQHIADLRGMSFSDFADQTTINAKRLFQLTSQS